MNISRPWAFWRQVQYSTGFGVVLFLFLTWGYYNFLYAAPTCFDLTQNGEERGIDCGGACTRICAFDVTQPKVEWARSFKVTDGQYNAVAYVTNSNQTAATPEVTYTFSLYDAAGLITERSGTTVLPPNSEYPIFEGRIATGERIPTRTFLDLEPAPLWLPAESGREQFQLIDRSLSSVDERPRLDALLENTALTEAKEVEVVATIFDARGNALTSSRTFVDEFQPRERREVVFTWPEPIAKTLRSCEVPTDVVLAIDLSGSMNNDQEEPPEPLSSVIAAAESFIDRLQPNDQIGLVTFATEADRTKNLSPDQVGVEAAVAALAIDPEEETGSTNTGAALQSVIAEFRSTAHNPNARKVAVLLTDGLATAPEEEPEQFAIDQAYELRADGVEVYAIGLGQQVNMEFVEQLATEPSYAYQAINRAQVDAIYRTITASICEDGAAIISVIAKSDAGFSELR